MVMFRNEVVSAMEFCSQGIPSVQRIHSVWPLVIVVQSACTIFPCHVARRLDPDAAQEVYAAVRAAAGQLRRGCKTLAKMPRHRVLAQRRSLVCGWDVPSCEGRYCTVHLVGQSSSLAYILI